jgi:hypothetical protein
VKFKGVSVGPCPTETPNRLLFGDLPIENWAQAIALLPVRDRLFGSCLPLIEVLFCGCLENYKRT